MEHFKRSIYDDIDNPRAHFARPSSRRLGFAVTASAAAALVFGVAGVVPARAESLNAVLAQAASRAAGDVAVLPAAEGESVTVTTAQEFIDALTKGTAPSSRSARTSTSTTCRADRRPPRTRSTTRRASGAS